jgi:hypothetical protein
MPSSPLSSKLVLKLNLNSLLSLRSATLLDPPLLPPSLVSLTLSPLCCSRLSLSSVLLSQIYIDNPVTRAVILKPVLQELQLTKLRMVLPLFFLSPSVLCLNVCPPLPSSLASLGDGDEQLHRSWSAEKRSGELAEDCHLLPH